MTANEPTTAVEETFMSSPSYVQRLDMMNELLRRAYLAGLYKADTYWYDQHSCCRTYTREEAEDLYAVWRADPDAVLPLQWHEDPDDES